MKLSRRDTFKIVGLLAATATLEASQVKTKKKTADKAPLPKKIDTRVVIVGGGWSGLSVAKNIKMLSKDIDVVLVE
ncbi:MAG: NAD(P)/FAD-dependent oxidoreductase, partial [Campylobacterota bacterium]|nr:NAD(P)/FAD-dependent oxidoreductase [Campylobacterota bacterium]